MDNTDNVLPCLDLEGHRTIISIISSHFKRLKRPHKDLPRDFFISTEVPIFQHSLNRHSKDLKKGHIRYEVFCKTHFLRQKIPPPRIKLFRKPVLPCSGGHLNNGQGIVK